MRQVVPALEDTSAGSCPGGLRAEGRGQVPQGPPGRRGRTAAPPGLPAGPRTRARLCPAGTSFPPAVLPKTVSGWKAAGGGGAEWRGSEGGVPVGKHGFQGEGEGGTRTPSGGSGSAAPGPGVPAPYSAPVPRIGRLRAPGSPAPSPPPTGPAPRACSPRPLEAPPPRASTSPRPRPCRPRPRPGRRRLLRRPRRPLGAREGRFAAGGR